MKPAPDHSLREYLLPSKLINSDHPSIVRKSEEITSGTVQVEDKARDIFYFIRDQICYDFNASFQEEDYYASEILKAGKGFCTQKAILFCALSRCCKIPAGIYFYNIVDYTLPRYITEILKTRTLYHHGIATLLLNGQWRQYDATLDLELTERKQRYSVEFSPDHHCLMRKKTKTGENHIEYGHDYGLRSNVTFKDIVAWLEEDYPHLFDIVPKVL